MKIIFYKLSKNKKMINFNRVSAMIYRYYVNMKHTYDRLTDMFYWPAMDLFLWGLTGLYFAKLNSNNPNTIIVILTGLIYWIVIWRTQYEVSINLLTEMWDQNLVNIFASPLRVTEWIISVIIFGFIKMFVSITFSAGLAFLLYQYPVFVYGFFLIPTIISLMITGWAVGFFVAGLLIQYGQRIQTIAWMGVVILAPFSALYYPVSVLPTWAQKVSLIIPSSYAFEGMREILFTGHASYDKLLISFLLNGIYLIFSIWFFISSFNKSKKLGLGRLI